MREEQVIGKLVASGELVLDAPLLIGVGAGGRDEEDIHMLRDQQGIPLIPGTSLAGVLRDFLASEDAEACALLFGTEQSARKRGGLPEMQSAVSLQDVRLADARDCVRDGVTIDTWTGTAAKHGKYNYEAIDAGAHGIFSVEITLRGIHERYEEKLKAAWQRLENLLLTGFPLGAHTAKGFGRVHLEKMQVDMYDFHNRQDVLAWLRLGEGVTPGELPSWHGESSSHQLLEADTGKPVYRADDFVIEADFSLRSSLIVRDYDRDALTAEEKALGGDTAGNGEKSLAAVMKRDSRGNFLLPGTSLKGALRHRAAHILRALGKSDALLDQMMGLSPARMQALGRHSEDRAFRSPFEVSEAHLRSGVKQSPQSRNRIDRFTGGTMDTALFTTLPIWQKETGKPVLHLRFGVHRAEAWQAGLALLLLKDLWLGRVALGGEKSIGRGRLSGCAASIHYQGEVYELEAGQPLEGAQAARLQAFVTALVETEAEEGERV